MTSVSTSLFNIDTMYVSIVHDVHNIVDPTFGPKAFMESQNELGKPQVIIRSFWRSMDSVWVVYPSETRST